MAPAFRIKNRKSIRVTRVLPLPQVYRARFPIKKRKPFLCPPVFHCEKVKLLSRWSHFLLVKCSVAQDVLFTLHP
jgi:hypothetical protein